VTLSASFEEIDLNASEFNSFFLWHSKIFTYICWACNCNFPFHRRTYSRCNWKDQNINITDIIKVSYIKE